MTPENVYALLIRSEPAVGCDSFDMHLLASILSAGAMDVGPGRSLTDAVGLPGHSLRRVLQQYFPEAEPHFEAFGLDSDLKVDEEERCLRELLRRSRSTAGPLGSLLSILVARRCARPNHLWQDLGLRNRGELSRLMLRHFAPLAKRNSQDMKWKKFFYRMICSEEGFSLCTAPSCSECSDFENCFGDESGESLLARTRFNIEAQGLISIAHACVQ
jgi:nitrogen fixation protein NifQ